MKINQAMSIKSFAVTIYRRIQKREIQIPWNYLASLLKIRLHNVSQIIK